MDDESKKIMNIGAETEWIEFKKTTGELKEGRIFAFQFKGNIFFIDASQMQR